MSEWTSCCKGRMGCPEIRIDEHDVRIRDDFDNEIVMTHDQFLDVIATGADLLADLFPPVPEEIH